MRGIILVIFALALAAGPKPAFAQAPAPAEGNDSGIAPVQPHEDKRVFGVIPNNRTTEASAPYSPIPARRKMGIAIQDSFDWPVLPTSAAFAAVYQLENQNPSFGQGMKGYAQRLAAAYGDQMTGNMMTEGIFPTLLHEDPRYFRLGEGSTWARARHALISVMVTRTDSGGKRFNFSEWGGNAAASALANAWYPDTRTASDNAQKLVTQVGLDALSNVLKEFWPDVKRRVFGGHSQQ